MQLIEGQMCLCFYSIPLTLHRHFLSACYLSGLSFSGEHEWLLSRMIEQNIEWSVTRRSDDG